MEISFCSRSLATPCRGNSGIPLGSACHGPTHSLRILRGQIPGDREETGFLAGIHDRQLLALKSIGTRSEEHTSELQSLMRISYAVFCLNKKHNTYGQHYIPYI